jgi:drug/metabolite transporter (DMT)-like permease
MKDNPYINNLACFSAMFLWAIGFPAAEILLDSWGALTLVFFRFFITVILLIPFWIFLEGIDTFLNSPITKGLRIGFIGWGLGAILLLVGQKLSDPVTPTICAAMMPIFGAIVEVAFDNRKMKLNLIIGICLAIFGGYLATGVNLSEGTFNLGTIICLISVMLFAWCTRSSTKELKNISVLGQTSLTMAGGMIAALFFLILSLLFNLGETQIGDIDSFHLILLFIFIFISQTVSQTIWMWGAKGLGVLFASFHSNAVPFYVMIIMVFLFGDIWNWVQASGAFVVALGVIIAQNNKWDYFINNRN